MDNQKIENQLNLALDVPANERESSEYLSTGFNPVTNTWDLVVKYNGDLTPLRDVVIRIDELGEQYAIVVVSQDQITRLAEFPQIEYIEKPKNFYFMVQRGKRASCIPPVQEAPLNLTGKGVLVGIIDSGIDYFHPDFRNEDGSTRIVSIYDIGGTEGSSSDPAVEYTREQINQALNATSREEGLKIVPSQDFIGHGTHVAGIAAGNGRASNGANRGVAYESELIIVKLGREGGEPLAKTTEIMKGINYLINKAQELGRPIAINISYGNNYGSHDGNSLFETYMDTKSNQWKNVIVVGTGNEGASSHHYRNTITSGATQTVDIAISEFEKSVNIQLWKSHTDVFFIEIEGPNGERSGVIRPILGTQQFQIAGTKVLLYFGEPSPFMQDQEVYIELLPSGEYITGGSWKIHIQAQQVVDGVYDLWLPVSSGLNTFTRFQNPEANTTLTVPSTASKVITVGAYNTATNSIASFSGRGYTRKTSIIKPNIVAPGVDILSTYPGGRYESLSGTSMATPFVTGAAALMMEWGIVKGNDPYMYGQKVKSYLQRYAKRDASRTYPDPSWGYGTLCLEGVFTPTVPEVTEVNTRYEVVESAQMMVTDKGEVRTIGDNCNDIIMSEDYLDIIVEYVDSLDQVTKLYEPACIQVIDDRFAILHLKLGEKVDFSRPDRSINTRLIPQLLSPYAKSALESSGVLVFHDQPFLPLRGQGVVIGVIDTGIDYTNSIFQYEGKTSKIISIWDQTIQGSPPKSFAFGTEYSRDQINQALASENPFEVVPTRDEYGHGTYMAGTAAGNEAPEADFIGAAPDAELIVVKLKPAKRWVREFYLVEEQMEPVYMCNDVMLGIKYIADLCRSLGRPLSLVIGIGSNAGAHDGSSFLESFLLDVSSRQGEVVTVCAGNEANLAHHYYNNFSSGEATKTIEISVAPNELGFILYIWSHAPDTISVAITSPTGEYIDRIPARLKQIEEIELVLEKTVIYVEYQLTEERTGDQLISIRMWKPTEGIWTITVYGDLIVDGRIDAWLPRQGYIKEQTVFLSPTTHTTITFPANSIGSITAGGYNHQSGSLYLSSGRGLTRDLEMKPDLVAPAVNVIGPFPGNRFAAMTGTSVSAAIVSGAAALLLEWGIILGNDPEMDGEKVLNYLIKGARRRQGLTYPNREWGYGELNLFGTFEALR